MSNPVAASGVNTVIATAGSAYSFSGLPWADLVSLATFLFITVQFFVLTPRIWNTAKAWYLKFIKKDSELFDELSEVPLEKDEK